MTGIANAFRAESPPLFDDRRAGAPVAAQDGLLQAATWCPTSILCRRSPNCGDVPHTEPDRRHGIDGFRESVSVAPGPVYLEIPRDVLDARLPLERARIPKPGGYRRIDKILIGDPNDIERLADILVNIPSGPARLFGTQVWTCRGHDAALSFAAAEISG